MSLIHCVIIVRFLLWFFLRSTCSFQTKQVLSSFSTPMLATLLSYSNWMTRNENFVYYYNFFSGAPSLIFSCFPSKSKLRKTLPNSLSRHFTCNYVIESSSFPPTWAPIMSQWLKILWKKSQYNLTSHATFCKIFKHCAVPHPRVVL